MKHELFCKGDPDLKAVIDDKSDLVSISFHCERLATATELMELEEWIHSIVKLKYFEK